jgi:hypothetical protein
MSWSSFKRGVEPRVLCYTWSSHRCAGEEENARCSNVYPFDVHGFPTYRIGKGEFYLLLKLMGEYR